MWGIKKGFLKIKILWQALQVKNICIFCEHRLGKPLDHRLYSAQKLSLLFYDLKTGDSIGSHLDFVNLSEKEKIRTVSMW